MVSDVGERCNELVAWLSSFEVEQESWRRSGYSSYKAYLCSIDTSGRLRQMIDAHSKTVARRNKADQNIRKYWPDTPELHELLNRKDGEQKWQRLSHLTRLTKDQPELAKECLNRAYVERLTKRDRKREDTRWFISADFRRAQELADQVNDREETDLEVDIDAFRLKFWRGILMPAHLHLGHADLDSQGSRIRTITPSMPPVTPRKQRALPPRAQEREPEREEEEGGEDGEEEEEDGEENGEDGEEGGEDGEEDGEDGEEDGEDGEEDGEDGEEA